MARPIPQRAPDRHEQAHGFRIWHMQGAAKMDAPHTHPDIEFNFLFNGGFSYLHGGAVVPVEPGRFTVLWGGVPHQTLPPGIVGEGIWCTLPLGWFLQWRLPRALPDRLLRGEIVAGAPDLADRPLLERWLADARSGEPARLRVLQLEMEARFHRLALGTAEDRRGERRPAGEAGAGQIARVTRFIAQHYREPLDVRAIADHAKLHPKYLMRVFRKQSGASIWEYLLRLRVSHAQRLLITTDLKVLDVAMESGFSSVAPFYAAFARHSAGLRPLEYRHRHRPATEAAPPPLFP
ncbi:MAG: helix-turn-helix domain-containing protein [Opitutaceae bacterium]|nr:helix-turn-helix domain-containing protein [Opitutaceae bacterium]